MREFVLLFLLVLMPSGFLYSQKVVFSDLKITVEDGVNGPVSFNYDFNNKLWAELLNQVKSTLLILVRLPSSSVRTGLEAMRYVNESKASLIIYGTLNVQDRALYAEVRFVGSETPIALDYAVASDVGVMWERLAEDLAKKIVDRIQNLVGLSLPDVVPIMTEGQGNILLGLGYPVRIHDALSDSTLPLGSIQSGFEWEIDRPTQMVNFHMSPVVITTLGYSMSINREAFERVLWNTVNIEGGAGLVWYMRQWEVMSDFLVGFQVHIISKDALYDKVKTNIGLTPITGANIRVSHRWKDFTVGLHSKLVWVWAKNAYLEISPGLTFAIPLERNRTQ